MKKQIKRTNKNDFKTRTIKKNVFLMLGITILIIIFSINISTALNINNETTWWKFNEASGNAIDSSGAGITLTNSNVLYSNGKINNGADFDGTTSYFKRASIPNELIFGTGNFSFSFWINTTDNTSGNGVNIYSKRPPGSLDNKALMISLVSGKITWKDNTGIVSSTNTINSGLWRLITLTKSGTTLKIYIDGTLDSTHSIANNDYGNSLDAVYLGVVDGGAGEFLPGSLDDFRIFKGLTLNQTQIDSIYNGGFGTEKRLSQIDDNSIIINLESPIDNFETTQTSLVFNSTLNPIDNVSLINATLMIWFENGTLFNKTTNLVTGNVSNLTQFNITNLQFENYNWNVLGCGENSTTDTICSYAESNFTFKISKFSIVSQSFNEDVFETNSETFEINISTIDTILSISSNLIYNGTIYPSTTICSSGLCESNVTLDIPLINSINENEYKSFLWNTTVFDGSTTISSLSSVNQQNVSKIHLEKCDATYTINTLNFTTYDEENLTRITSYDFDGNFEYWLGGGSVKKNISLSDDGISEEKLCISPGNNDYIIDAQIDYYQNNNNLTYVTRNYYFQQATINNITQDINLLLLKAEDSTTFILKVQDNTQQPIPNSLINIQRYYPGEGIFRTVQIAKTDSKGESVGFYKTETVDYKHIIVLNNSVLLDTTRGKVVGNDIPFTLTFTTGSSSNNPWDVFEDNPNILTSLSYNDTSEIVTYSYIDTTGTITFGRLLVEQWSNMNNTKISICDVNSSFSSATLTCNVTGYDGSIVAQGFISTSNTLTDLLTFIANASKDIFDKTGLILALFIILTSAMAFIWNPTVGIIGINASIIFVNVIGLATFSPIFIFSIIGASIYIMIVMKT